MKGPARRIVWRKHASRAILCLAVVATVGAGPASYSGPVIDAHAHLRLGESDWIRQDQPIGPQAIRQADDKAGIVRSALIVIGFGDPAAVKSKNDAVIAAAAADPVHFYPVASVNPDNGDASLEELDRVARAGVKVIKLHPVSQEFDVGDPRIARIAQRCGDLGMTVLFDSFDPFDPGQVGKFVRLALAQPKTRFMLAHMGFVRFREMLTFAELRRAGLANNVWFDLSAIVPAYSGSPVQAELVWTIRQIGTDRMVFGSDWPIHSPAQSLVATRKLGLTASEQRQVFHDNISELIGKQ